MQFCKLHGCGNDYLVIEEPALRGHDLAELARAMCDRHYGAGADGIAVLAGHPITKGEFTVRIFNPDGSEAEVSGNGTRCAAAYVYHAKGRQAPTLNLHTISGVKEFNLIERKNNGFIFATNMGSPWLKPAEIPLDLALLDSTDRGRIVDYPVAVEGMTARITALSMGNPHCAVFVSDWDQVDVAGLGRELESHPLFPNRTNVEFIKVIDRENIEARFYERGVGLTLSSGSSSCAATVASVLNGLTERSLNVHTPAGVLQVEWRAGGSLLLTGPAEVVYEGRWLR